MSIDVRPWLDKLEKMINLDHVANTSDLQKRAFQFEPVDHVPTIVSYPVPDEEWPQFSFAEIFEQSDKMLLNELVGVYIGAKIKDDRLYGVRANYGTGIVASMFGCKTRTFEDTLPIGLRVEPDKLDEILDADVPDVRSGIVGRALDTVSFFRDALESYPKLSQTVGIEMLDIQGPFDNVSIIWGSEVFLALYDVPENVMRLSELVTEAILEVVKAHRKIDGNSIGEHYGDWRHLGGLCIRNDSSVSLNKNQYEQFVKPFDVRLLSELGGWIHFCGRAHQWWESLLDISGLRGINPYQGEFYDLMDMFDKCERARVPIIQWTNPLNADCRNRVRTGFSRTVWVDSYDQACASVDRLRSTGHADGE